MSESEIMSAYPRAEYFDRLPSKHDIVIAAWAICGRCGWRHVCGLCGWHYPPEATPSHCRGCGVPLVEDIKPCRRRRPNLAFQPTDGCFAQQEDELATP
jgi:hypothetical protein